MKRKVDDSDEEELPLLPINKKSAFPEESNPLPTKPKLPAIDADETFVNNTGMTFDSDDDDMLEFPPNNLLEPSSSSNPKQKLMEKNLVLNDLDMDDFFGPAPNTIRSNIFTSERFPTLPRPNTVNSANDTTRPKSKTDYQSQPSGHYQSATSSSGVKLYFPKKSTAKPTNPATLNQGRLLSDRISVLMDQAKDQLKLKKALELSAIEERNRQENFFDPLQPFVPIKKELWVDKYAPKLYTDLVGDEVILHPTYLSKPIELS